NPGGFLEYRGDDEPGVVVDTGEHLAFAAVGEEYAAHQVQLPQMHRRLSFPPLVDSFMLLFLRIDETVAHQDAVDRRAGRGTVTDFPVQLVGDASRSPPSVVTARSRISTDTRAAMAESDSSV